MPKLSGIIAPILTPFGSDGTVANDLWVSHAKWVLDQGAHYLSPFGTTGEALSLSPSERMAAVEALVNAGIPADRLMPGTGLPSLVDTTELTRHAVALGVKGVMELPSFFYTDANEDGHFRYFEALVGAIADPKLQICLYNIPQNSGVEVTPSLAARLNKAFPEVFMAYKDSCGDWDHTQQVIAAAPALAVFPGSESFLTQGLANGCAGCISATVNVNAAAIRAVYDATLTGADVTETDRAIKDFRTQVQDAGLIRAMKAMLAVRSGDDRWLNLRPPLLNGTHDLGDVLLTKLGHAADHIGPDL